jgi:ATP-dependent Clp protease ATP-binding subunit ClpA
MFERFTERARSVVVQAQVEARELGHRHIGTEHLLLGVIQQGEGLAIRVLISLNVDSQAMADQVKELVGHGENPLPPSGHIPFTPPAKKTLELALREALQLKHDYIGSEHILLGLIAEGQGPAYQVLTANGVDLDTARAEVTKQLGDPNRSITVRRTRVQIRDMPAANTDFELRRLSRRLATIEARLGIETTPAEKQLLELEAELDKVRRDKVAAIDAQDFEAAAGLRAEEKRLTARRAEVKLAWEEEQPLL